MPMLRWGAAIVAAWLLGSLPWGLWFGRWLRGIDVRQHGSGNRGATNVYRLLGPAPGIAVLLLDAAKGVAAVWACRFLAGSAGEWSGLVGLMAAVLGHSFTPFAGFRGGKGVATAAGAWGVLAPAALFAALGLWALIFAVTRIVSVASIVASVALPLAVLWVQRAGRPGPVLGAAALTAVLVVVRHRGNLRRLVRGEEKRLNLRGPGRSDGSPNR